MLQIILFAMLAFAGVAFLLLWVLRSHIRKISACGYLPQDPGPIMRWIVVAFSRCITWWQAKSVKISGWENLNTPGPKIIAPNHTHYLDPLVWPGILEEKARYLVDSSVFKFFGGYAGLLLSAGGGIPVDLEKGKGTAARLAGIKAMVSGRDLVIFPEGYAYLDGSVNEFKKGTVRIAKAAAAESGAETYIVPVYMRYGKYAPAWFKKYSNPVQFALIFLMAPYYRAGLEIVIGKAIPASQLPEDDVAANAILRQAVVELDPLKLAR